MNEQVLQDLGLSLSEVKAYMALMRLGESTTGAIVDESGIAVSKIYTILEKLIKKGLVSYTLKKKTKYFIPAPPARLLDYYREKEESLKKKKEELLPVIKSLEFLAGSAIKKETFQLFEGLRGIQTARERALKEMTKGDEMWIIGISKTPYEGSMTPYFKDFHERRSKRKIKCKYLYNEYAKDFAKESAKYPNSEVRLMKKGLITHAWIEVYANTVTIGINLRKSLSIVIDDEDIANSFKVYAQMLWSISKKLPK